MMHTKRYGPVGMRAEFQLFHPSISDAVITEGKNHIPYVWENIV